MLNALHIIGRAKADHHNRNILIENINKSIANIHDNYIGRLGNNAINISNLIIFFNREDSFENFINNWEQEIEHINNIIEDPIDLNPIDLNIITTYVNCIRNGVDALTNNNTLLSFQDIENALLKIKIILPNDEFTNLFNYLHKINNGSTQFSTLFFNHYTALFNIVEIIRTNLNETIKDKSIFHKVN